MLSVIDHVFSLNTKFGNNKDFYVNTSFIYNYYKDDETVVDDNIIRFGNASRYKKRFVRLSLINHNGSDSSDYNQDNFVQEVYDFAQSSMIRLDNLKYFNKLDLLNNKRKYVINKTSDNVINNMKSFYLKDEFDSNYSFLISERMSYLKPEKHDVSTNNLMSHDFFSFKDFKELDSVYDSLITANLPDQGINQSNNVEFNVSLFKDFTKFKSIINEVNTVENDFSNKNAIRCGLLIEKFILKDEEYEFLCAKFISKDKNSSSLNLNSVYEDEAVKYGKTYRYVISNVYLYAQLDPNNRFIVNQYLVCDHPFVTDNVICKESEPPPPPVNLRFKVINSKLEIRWDEPHDYQYDAKGYQILRRDDVNESYTIIGQLEGHSEKDLYDPQESTVESVIHRTPDVVPYKFVDNDYNKGEITIYAIRTIDAHGYFSDYSDQIAILYDPFEEKLIYDLICYSGCKRDYPNEKILLKSKFFKYNDNMIDNLPIAKKIKNVTLYVTPDYCKIKRGGEEMKVLSDSSDIKYKFTMFRLNDLGKHEKTLKFFRFSKSQSWKDFIQ